MDNNANNQNENEETASNSTTRNNRKNPQDFVKENLGWLIKFAAVVVVIVAFYYAASPFQNCVRADGSPSAIYCSTHTSW